MDRITQNHFSLFHPCLPHIDTVLYICILIPSSPPILSINNDKILICLMEEITQVPSKSWNFPTKKSKQQHLDKSLPRGYQQLNFFIDFSSSMEKNSFPGRYKNWNTDVWCEMCCCHLIIMLVIFVLTTGLCGVARNGNGRKDAIKESEYSLFFEFFQHDKNKEINYFGEKLRVR